MENKKDILTEMYTRYLGANPPEPEDIPRPPDEVPPEQVLNIRTKKEEPEDVPIPRLQILDDRALLDGTPVILSDADVANITTIVAAAAARNAEQQLEEWRARYALRKEE